MSIAHTVIESESGDKSEYSSVTQRPESMCLKVGASQLTQCVCSPNANRQGHRLTPAPALQFNSNVTKHMQTSQTPLQMHLLRNDAEKFNTTITITIQYYVKQLLLQFMAKGGLKTRTMTHLSLYLSLPASTCSITTAQSVRGWPCTNRNTGKNCMEN